jgi:DnaK suppressor protein
MSKKSGSKAVKAKAAKSKPALKKSAGAIRAATAKAPAAKPKIAEKAANPKIKPAAAPQKPAPADKRAKAESARTMSVSKPAASTRTQEGSQKMAARAKTSEVVLPSGYRPSESEPFMNEMHRAYFRKRLLDWKEEILRQTRETLEILHEDSTQHADLADRATSETDRATELRTRDRQRKLIAKIDAALGRIEDGTYGYCEETGEPIGLKRLEARPIATLSVEAQERHERREKVYREE